MDDGLNSRRGWWQFSLRGLLGVMVLAALGLGWIAGERRKVWLEKRAVEEIERLGGVVLRNGEGRFAGAPTSEAELWKEWLFGEEYCRPVMSVEFKPGVGSEAVALLGPLRELRLLTLAGARIGDEEVSAILEHSGLEALDLSATDITDVGAERLAELPELTDLSLDHTAITERTLATLAGKSFSTISICDTDVSRDAAEGFLAGLSDVFIFEYASEPWRGYRQAAQRAIRMGVNVWVKQIESSGCGGRLLDRESPVTEVGLGGPGEWSFAPEDLECLKDLRSIHTIYVWDPVGHWEYVEKLAELDVAEGIKVCVLNTGESAKGRLLQTLGLLPRMRRLEELQFIFHDEIREETLDFLPDVEGLRSLALRYTSVYGGADVAEGAFRPIGDCRALEELTLGGMVLPRETLFEIARCQALKRLVFEGVDSCNCDVQGCEEMESLRSLTIRCGGQPGVAPTWILPVPNLEEFEICDVHLSEAAIERVAQCTTLRRLTIRGSGLSDEDVERLTALRELEVFSYTPGSSGGLDGGLTEASLGYLLELPNLRKVELVGVEGIDEVVYRRFLEELGSRWGEEAGASADR